MISTEYIGLGLGLILRILCAVSEICCPLVIS